MLWQDLLAVCLLLGVPAVAAPNQHVLEQKNKIDPLKHLSAISPFFIPADEPTPLPQNCSLTRATLLIRHSSIMGNDDEYELTMQPFIEKIHKMNKKDKKHGKKHESSPIPKHGDWAFLRKWETPIVEEHLEEVSERGKRDARMLGKYIRSQYDSLFPAKDETGAKQKKHSKSPKSPYKVWTASSTRDIESAKNYIIGSFPKHQSGKDGHGDGEVVQLVKVPNKSREWEKSLTPHKACSTFEKLSSLKPANQWLSVIAPRIRARIAPDMPDLVEHLDDQDILAMAMLCGYESIAQGHSSFCHLFTDAEWLDFEYYFDVRFHYMMGYGNDLSPYLGMPWVKTAKHLLAGKDGDDGTNHTTLLQPLPKPQLPPNATHTQLLHPSFTHRESPAFVAVFLNLYNSTELQHSASEAPALDYRPSNRAWRTSHLVSFLGHVALERFRHEASETEYVRAVVNGKQERMYGCDDGLDWSCKWETFDQWVDDRAMRWGDWNSVCDK